MNIFSLLPGILRTIGSALGLNIVKDAGNALAAAQLSPDQQAALQTALLEHEAQMSAIRLDELRAVLGETTAMIQSPDKYTSRARPTGLYVAYVGTIGLIAAIVFGVKIDSGAIITLLAPMWGSAAWYSYNRTQEKIGGNGK